MSVVDRSHRALSIPDIMLEIGELLSPHDAARAARVRKSWLEISLDVVWKGPVPLERLLSVLAPLAYCTFEDTWVSSLL